MSQSNSKFALVVALNAFSSNMCTTKFLYSSKICFVGENIEIHQVLYFEIFLGLVFHEHNKFHSLQSLLWTLHIISVNELQKGLDLEDKKQIGQGLHGLLSVHCVVHGVHSSSLMGGED